MDESGEETPECQSEILGRGKVEGCHSLQATRIGSPLMLKPTRFCLGSCKYPRRCDSIICAGDLFDSA